MKRLIPCFLLIPLLSSCVVQEEYYAPGYYPPPPPPPYVEVHRYDEPRHGYEHRHGYERRGYRAAPQGREQGRFSNQRTVHGHGQPGFNPQQQGRMQPPARPQVPVRPQAPVRPQPSMQQHAPQIGPGRPVTQPQGQAPQQRQGKPNVHGHGAQEEAQRPATPKTTAAVVPAPAATQAPPLTQPGLEIHH